MLDSSHIPPTPLALIGGCIAAGFGLLAAGMAEWAPGDWAAFAGTLTFLGTGLVGGLAYLLKLVVAFRRDMREIVSKAAAADPYAHTALPRTREELEALIAESAERAAMKAIEKLRDKGTDA